MSLWQLHFYSTKKTLRILGNIRKAKLLCSMIYGMRYAAGLRLVFQRLLDICDQIFLVLKSAGHPNKTCRNACSQQLLIGHLTVS